jgi:hypothetical protein
MTKKCIKCLYNNPNDFTLNFTINSQTYCDDHGIYVIKHSGDKNMFWSDYLFKLLEYMNISGTSYHG